jgi:hypothetical protein
MLNSSLHPWSPLSTMRLAADDPGVVKQVIGVGMFPEGVVCA